MFLYTGRGALSTSIPSIVAEGVFTKESLGAVGTVLLYYLRPVANTGGHIGGSCQTSYHDIGRTCRFGAFHPAYPVFLSDHSGFISSGDSTGLSRHATGRRSLNQSPEIMPSEQRMRGSVSLALSGPIGALGLFVTSAIVFSITGWRALFFIASILMASFSIITYFGLGKVCRHLKADRRRGSRFSPRIGRRCRAENIRRKTSCSIRCCFSPSALH